MNTIILIILAALMTGCSPLIGTENPEVEVKEQEEVVEDQILHPKTLIYGIAIDGKAIAFTKDFIVSKGTFQGYLGHGQTKIPLYLLYNPDTEQLEVTRFFKDTPGKKEPFAPVPAFWFSWLAQYPDTELVD
jgi:hypothetical protein